MHSKKRRRLWPRCPPLRSENATRAGEADRLMQEASKTVQQAAQAMEGLTNSMNLISKSSSQVAAVLKSIDEIAFHTNILALNAAVEAARAGEAGAGFSVVADEVRSLAHRAAEAARNSGDIIERTIADVNKGVELATVAHGAFSLVTTKIAGGSQVMSQIAASSDEQARGITNIGQAINRIELLTQNNAANAHRTAEAALSWAPKWPPRANTSTSWWRWWARSEQLIFTATDRAD